MDYRCIYLVLLLLFVTSTSRLCDGKSPADDDEGDVAKQHRLFQKFPITELLQDEQLADDSLSGSDPLDSRYAAFQSFMHRQRARPHHNSPYEPSSLYSSYEKPQLPVQSNSGGQIFGMGHYDSERELESSQPYGIQNVLEGQNARLPRSKNHLAKITFQSLCPSKRETVFLNLESEYEYRPDHYEEVTCAQPFLSHHEFKNTARAILPVCGEAGFSCIQLNRTLFLTRRAHGADCWESETRLVAAGCECMWPKHHLGDISAHH